jgi:hypothetical protein
MELHDHTSDIKVDDVGRIIEIVNPTTLGFDFDTAFWRGHGNAEWSLLPHVFRPNPLNAGLPYNECALIGHFQMRAPTRSHIRTPEPTAGPCYRAISESKNCISVVMWGAEAAGRRSAAPDGEREAPPWRRTAERSSKLRKWRHTRVRGRQSSMTERKSGLPRTRSSEFGSSAHGDICDSPKHQPAIAFVGPTPSRVCGSVKPVRIGQQAERHHCSELAGETGPLEWRLLMHSPPRRQTASDYLERDTVPPGGRSTNGPLYLHGQFQISRFGRFLGLPDWAKRATHGDGGADKRIAEFHGGNERQPLLADRPDDVRYVATACAVLHARPDTRMITFRLPASFHII